MEYKPLISLKIDNIKMRKHKPTKSEMVRELIHDDTFKALNNTVLNNNTLECHYYNLLYSLMFSQTFNFLYQAKEEIEGQITTKKTINTIEIPQNQI